MRALGADDAHMARRDRAARDALALERDPGERVQAGRDVLLVGAGVEQCAEQHVAGQAADGVDVEQTGHRAPAAERAIRAAIVPAPKPSSMPTTARPAAQEESIASSAVSPPSAVP